MTNCSFMCKDEHSADELMDKIWESIRYWIEFKRKEMILCKWCDKEGYQVAVSAADKAKISMALSFKTTENPEEEYELSIDKDGEVKNIRIPTDVITLDMEAMGKIVFSDDILICFSLSAYPKLPSKHTSSFRMIRTAHPAICPEETKRLSVFWTRRMILHPFIC